MSFRLRDLFQSRGLWLSSIASHKRVATSLRPTGAIQGVQGCWATSWHWHPSWGRKEREKEKEGDRGLFLDSSSDLRILESWVLLLRRNPRICWRRESTSTEAPICFPFWNSGPKMKLTPVTDLWRVTTNHSIYSRAAHKLHALGMGWYFWALCQ